LVRFLPAATGRNVTDFSQKSLHVDANLVEIKIPKKFSVCSSLQQVKLHAKPTFFEILL
jgi:hypothetical protein